MGSFYVIVGSAAGALIQIISKKAGKVVNTIRVVFSHDGKTRTQTGQGTNAQGIKTNNTVVYEK